MWDRYKSGLSQSGTVSRSRLRKSRRAGALAGLWLANSPAATYTGFTVVSTSFLAWFRHNLGGLTPSKRET